MLLCEYWCSRVSTLWGEVSNIAGCLKDSLLWSGSLVWTHMKDSCSQGLSPWRSTKLDCAMMGCTKARMLPAVKKRAWHCPVKDKATCLQEGWRYTTRAFLSISLWTSTCRTVIFLFLVIFSNPNSTFQWLALLGSPNLYIPRQTADGFVFWKQGVVCFLF